MPKGMPQLWLRRLVIVAFAIMWCVVAYSVLQDALTSGPTVGYARGRIPHAASNVGALLFFLIAGPIAAFWVFRTWNRSGREMPPPQSHFTRRRGKRRE
jgi:hypothetical protein